MSDSKDTKLQARAAQLLSITRKLRSGRKLSADDERILSEAQEPPETFTSRAHIAGFYGVTEKTVGEWFRMSKNPPIAHVNGWSFESISALRREWSAARQCIKTSPGDITVRNLLRKEREKHLNAENKSNTNDLDEETPDFDENTEENGEDVGESAESLLSSTEQGDVYDFQDLEMLKGKKLALECEKLKAHIQVLRRKWTSVDNALSQVRAMIYATKEKFRRLPSEVAYEVSGVTPAVAEEKIRTAVDKIMMELAEEDFAKLAKELEAIDETRKRIGPMSPSGREGHINPLAN